MIPDARPMTMEPVPIPISENSDFGQLRPHPGDQAIADYQTYNNHGVCIYSLSPDHIGVIAGSSYGAPQLCSKNQYNRHTIAATLMAQG